MAGYVDVYRSDGFEGCINIASERLRWLLQYLTECQKTSVVLQADTTLDVSEHAGMLHKYLSLIHYSDATVAEIARLLIEGADPAHLCWVDASSFFVDPNPNPNWKVDLRPKCQADREWMQRAFRDVAALIEQRLNRGREKG